MKKIKYLFLTILCFFPLSVFASTNTFTRTAEQPLVPRDVVVDTTNIHDILNTPAVSSSEKIYDYADLFNDQQEHSLYQQIDDYIDKTGIDACIVTTTDLKGFVLRDYAYHFYDYNDFMIEGVIFVIYMNEKEPEIFMGNSGDKTGKVFSIYSDVRISQILKRIYVDIQKKEYYTAAFNYITLLDGFYDLDRDGDYRISEDGSIVLQLPWTEIFVLAFAVTFIVVILCLNQIRSNNRLRFNNRLKESIDDGTLQVKLEMDDYLGTILSKRK